MTDALLIVGVFLGALCYTLIRGVLASLLTGEIKAAIAAYLEQRVREAAAKLQPEFAQDHEEEWLAELDELRERPIRALMFTIGLGRAAQTIAATDSSATSAAAPDEPTTAPDLTPVEVAPPRRLAARAAHRSVLEPHLAGLASEVHQVIAGTVLSYRGSQTGIGRGSALANARSAASVLRKTRLEVKYSLPGLDEPLRTLCRLPDWIGALNGEQSGQRLLVCAQALSRRVDSAIMRSYRRGRPPTRWEQWQLHRAAAQTRAAWNERFDG